jgi:tRNA pseudouridine55 synthase
VDGILNVNKPVGRTSFSIVALIRKLSRERRVGHAGTLDATASGVLPICLGKATRIVEFLMDAGKTYRTRIKLGAATDTYDAAGSIVQQGDASTIDRRQVEAALEEFRGRITQTPPMYSALKHQGRRLYQLARQGVTVERPGRPATIYSIELEDFASPVITLKVECARGTYIRSLAHDLGQRLGCGGHVDSLVRLGYGPFNIEDAVSLQQLEKAFADGSWQGLVYPIDSVLADWPSLVVAEEQEKVIRNGGSLAAGEVSGLEGQSCCRVYNRQGGFIAILQYDEASGCWQPQKVFA